MPPASDARGDGSGVDGHRPRAPRYPVSLPLVIRPAGHDAWYPGTISNASRTGILFESDACWPAGTLIEMQFQLVAGREEGSRVRCAGIVVRSHESPHRPATAAVLWSYWFAGESPDFTDGKWLGGDPVSRKESR